MIGAGRGYRWLQFLDATNLPIHDLPTISDAAAIGDEQLRDGWALVVKPDGAPLGWIDATGVRKHRGGASLRDSVTSVGAVFRPRRQPQPGIGRRVVVAGSDGRGRRQGGQGHRRSARR